MKFFFFFSFALGSVFVTAQNKGCGFLLAQDYLFQHDPTARARVQKLLEAALESPDLSARPSQAATYVIPVVFHVLHTNGSENISDAQIKDEIDILNQDFRKQNADTIDIVAPFQGLAADCDIEFRLATRDPDGNCTNGITRHYDQNTNWTVNFANYIYTWDPTKYLNIYVVKSMPSGMAAYTYLPGSVAAAADAIVSEHGNIGSIGTGNPWSSRVVTHETGHWFNLQHVWGSTNNAGVTCGDDGVADTPVTKGYTWCSLNNTDQCTQGVPENIQNYMDYANCQKMFTYGQRTRMHNALNSQVGGRNNLWTPSNLMATGVVNPLSNCAPKAQFIVNTTLTCNGNALSFTDQSYNAPITSWQWSSPQASNISTQQNGLLNFNNPGLASVKLKVSNAFGSDSVIKSAVVVLSPTVVGGANFTQSFDNGIFPDESWIATVPASGSGFTQNNAASYNGFKCAWVDNFGNSPKGPVSFFTPPFNMQGISAAQMSFYYAYAPRSNSGSETLKVYASSDCGASWSNVFTRSGSNLNTTGTVWDSPFVNPQFLEWQQVQVNINNLVGLANVYFRFEFTPASGATGNNFFLDDINLSRTYAVGIYENPGVLEQLSVSPNPFSQSLLISGEGITKDLGVRLFDISGRELKADKRVGEQHVALDVKGELASGIYFVHLELAGREKVVKVIRE